MLSKSVLQAKLNARSGSGSRLFANASFASCRSSTLGLSEISTMALSTASAPLTTSGGAKSLIRFISPIQAPLFVVQHDLVFGVSFSTKLEALITKSA